MQLFAKTKSGELLLANQAERGTDYLCTECGERLRVRQGQTPHFFHPHSPQKKHKSLLHQELQWKLSRENPELELERAFPEIGRIADLAWEKKKEVYEVQCSKVSDKELLDRYHDYQKMGWTVIWCLHVSHWKTTRHYPVPHVRFIDHQGNLFEKKIKPSIWKDVLRLYKRLFRRGLRHLFG